MNLSDLKRNAYMLRGSDAKRGYMRWWHSFQGVCPTTQETRTFFVEPHSRFSDNTPITNGMA